MVEHVTENHGVGSSILPLGTTFPHTRKPLRGLGHPRGASSNSPPLTNRWQTAVTPTGLSLLGQFPLRSSRPRPRFPTRRRPRTLVELHDHLVLRLRQGRKLREVLVGTAQGVQPSQFRDELLVSGLSFPYRTWSCALSLSDARASSLASISSSVYMSVGSSSPPRAAHSAAHSAASVRRPVFGSREKYLTQLLRSRQARHRRYPPAGADFSTRKISTKP